MFLAVLLIIIKVLFSQKAFIFSSSVGYYNYRQNANALKVYEMVKSKGFQDDDIILAFPENVGCCQKNPIQGSISFYDNEYQNINKNLQVDLKFSSISVSSILQSVRMKYDDKTLNIHRLNIGKEPYFLYFSGHGGDGYFKIRQRQAIVNQNFKHIFSDFFLRYPQNLIFVMIDSCSAITPFENINHDNFIAIGSSSQGEKSLSYGYDPLLNQPKSDEFTYYLGEFMKERQNSRDQSPTIKDLHNYMDFSKLKVHSKVVTTLKKNIRRPLKQFISKDMKISQKKLALKLPKKFHKKSHHTYNCFWRQGDVRINEKWCRGAVVSWRSGKLCFLGCPRQV